MSVIIYDGKFYCQTDETYLKFKQLSENPNAALCFKNFSVEGKCRCIGKPLDENNAFFAKAYKKYFLGSYKAYSSVSTERLLEIDPVLIYSWNYKSTKPFMEYWDFEHKDFCREYK